MADTLIMSIGNTRTVADGEIASRTDNADNTYEVVVLAAIPDNVEVGDFFTDDDNSWDYLIESISSDRLTVTVRDKQAA